MILPDNDLVFEIEFDDITMLESEGNFFEVEKIMEKEMFGGKEWMIETNVMINNPYGSSEMNLHFFSNKDVFIMSFATTSKEDVFYNPDIRCVSMWAQENGWNIPQPSPDLIGDNLNFWKHFWETGLINSKYLDKKYGKK